MLILMQGFAVPKVSLLLPMITPKTSCLLDNFLHAGSQMPQNVIIPDSISLLVRSQALSRT